MMASHLVKPDTRNCKRTRELEPQMPDSPQLSSLGKSDSSSSESSGLFYKDEALEKDLNDMSKEINLMLSTYAKILSERAAVDASYIDEIDGLFKEANTIENFLIQKRELLRQRFTQSFYHRSGFPFCDSTPDSRMVIGYFASTFLGVVLAGFRETHRRPPGINTELAFGPIEPCSSLHSSGDPGLKKYMENTHQKKAMFSKREGLPCITPLLTTVEETPQIISARVRGHFPKWLSGYLLRIGPGKFEFGKDKYNHWFDGMALLHQFRMEKGTVTYRSKFLQSDTYKANSVHDRIVISEFGTLALPDPCKSIFERFMSTFEQSVMTDNTNVNYVRYKGDYYISTETNFMNKVDIETLEKTEKVDWSKFIAVNGATAHPHYDPDGTAYNMGNSYGPHGSCYNVIQVPPEKVDLGDTIHGAQVICSIASAERMKPSYYHSFGMTRNYIIFIEQPLKMNLWKIVTSKIRGKAFSDGISWEPQYNTRFHVVDKHTGQLLPGMYYSKPFVTFHQINAFEDQGCVVIDMCCQDNGENLEVYQLQNLRKAGEGLDQVYNSMTKSFPRRFVLPLHVSLDAPEGQNLSPLSYSSASAVRQADGKIWCSYENLHPEDLEEEGGVEFPQINYGQFSGKKYHFFYGCGFRHLVGDSLIKVDVVNKTLKVWREDGFYPSEPVFVPVPGANEEDGGVILSVVITPNQNENNFLLVLDAKNFEELGRAEVPVQMPYGFHGTFVTI